MLCGALVDEGADPRPLVYPVRMGLKRSMIEPRRPRRVTAPLRIGPPSAITDGGPIPRIAAQEQRITLDTLTFPRRLALLI